MLFQTWPPSGYILTRFLYGCAQDDVKDKAFQLDELSFRLPGHRWCKYLLDSSPRLRLFQVTRFSPV